jgi:hypothetical protein
MARSIDVDREEMFHVEEPNSDFKWRSAGSKLSIDAAEWLVRRCDSGVGRGFPHRHSRVAAIDAAITLTLVYSSCSAFNRVPCFGPLACNMQ